MHSHIIFAKLLTVNFTELSNYNCYQKRSTDMPKNFLERLNSFIPSLIPGSPPGGEEPGYEANIIITIQDKMNVLSEMESNV